MAILKEDHMDLLYVCDTLIYSYSYKQDVARPTKCTRHIV